MTLPALDFLGEADLDVLDGAAAPDVSAAPDAAAPDAAAPDKAPPNPLDEVMPTTQQFTSWLQNRAQENAQRRRDQRPPLPTAEEVDAATPLQVY